MTSKCRRRKWRKRFRIAQACDLINNSPGAPDDEIWFNYREIIKAMAKVPIQRNGMNGGKSTLTPNELNLLIKPLLTAGVLDCIEVDNGAPFIDGASTAGRRCRLYRVMSNETLNNYITLTSTEMNRK